MQQSIPELLRSATESAALNAFPLFGKGDKNKSDELAVDAMRNSLNSLGIRTRVIIGEGEKDNAPMLFEGEILGSGEIEIDIAVDPLECTTNFSEGLPNSLSVLAFSERDGMLPVPGTYMEQWIAGPSLKEGFDLSQPLKKNIEKISQAQKKEIHELRIVVQNRPRHAELISELRNMNCSISLIDSGSITAVMDICLGLGHYDAMIGTYGAPEGLICALVAKATNSEMKAILRPHTEKHKRQWETLGGKHGAVLDKSDLIRGKEIGFIATGISTNHVLQGIKKSVNKISGQTIIITPGKSKIFQFEREV
ncbi:MAG: fructose-bisphosphatase class II family protein [Leptospira sp.]|nr:fructose-bisphosphatase class II family protein [Leptospira sp.]